MAKSKTAFFCRECGYESAKWSGQCPACKEWNTFVEEPVGAKTSKGRAASLHESAAPVTLKDISTEDADRTLTGFEEMDRVLGGGIVEGSLVLVGGDPGIGKSTLLLQMCRNVSAAGKNVLYISGEESLKQIKLRAGRIGDFTDNMQLLCETNLEAVESAIKSVKPDIVIIDSIQTMYREEISSAPGSVSQVRESTSVLMQIAKSMGISIFIVGHVTKEGVVAGPRVLEHMVDCVLYFEGDRQLSFRILRAVKNRFGSTNEIGVFEMCDSGLREVENPSMMLLEGRNVDISGSAIVCTMEGSRGVMAEIQALVTPTGFGNPRRMTNGIDVNRVLLLIAVLEKRARMNLSNSDIYVNVAGGLRIDETAGDLGICAAVATSQSDIPLPPDMIFIGEVGLGGELRGVSQLEKRINEAAKLGFKSAIVPKQSLRGVKIPDGFAAYGIKTISEMINMLRRK